MCPISTLFGISLSLRSIICLYFVLHPPFVLTFPIVPFYLRYLFFLLSIFYPPYCTTSFFSLLVFVCIWFSLHYFVFFFVFVRSFILAAWARFSMRAHGRASAHEESGNILFTSLLSFLLNSRLFNQFSLSLLRQRSHESSRFFSGNLFV